MPGHSSDSICLYNKTEGVLFVGDSPVLTASATGPYEAGFLAALERLCALDVRRIYFGHGDPVTERCNERLRESHGLAASGLIGQRNRITDYESAQAGGLVTQQEHLRS
jgi:glyoxylase-like metal-dependent hydrolase (beta-lactamase superfamily II)